MLTTGLLQGLGFIYKFAKSGGHRLGRVVRDTNLLSVRSLVKTVSLTGTNKRDLLVLRHAIAQCMFKLSIISHQLLGFICYVVFVMLLWPIFSWLETDDEPFGGSYIKKPFFFLLVLILIFYSWVSFASCLNQLGNKCMN